MTKHQYYDLYWWSVCNWNDYFICFMTFAMYTSAILTDSSLSSTCFVHCTVELLWLL